MKKLKITEDSVKEVALVIGFISTLRGLYLLSPFLMWLIGGIILLGFGFPGKKAVQK